MAIDYFGNEIDPITGEVKKKKNALQTQDVNKPDSQVKLSSEALSGAGADYLQTNEDILKKAQTEVLNQPSEPSELQNLVTQKATEFVSDPMHGFDPEKAKQAQLEQFNYDWANAYEKARQDFGNISGSGLLQKEMLDSILQRNVDRQSLETAIDTENLNRYLTANQTAIGVGNEVNATNEQIFAQRINNLAQVRAMAEGERLQERGYDMNVQLMAMQQGFDIEILDRQYGYEMSMMIANQDWTAAQNQLNRDMEFALQANDINAQMEIQKRQQLFELDYLFAQQEWESLENELNRQLSLAMQANDAILQHELLDKQYNYEYQMLSTELNWQAEENRLNRNLSLTMQANDIAATAANLQAQLALDEWKFRNQISFTAEQNALDRGLSVTLAQMDQETAYNSILLKGQVDSQLMTQSQDWQGVQNALDRQLSLTMQQNDWTIQRDLTQLQGQINYAAQMADQVFQDSQRVATQAWTTSERLGTQDWQAAMQYYEYEFQEAAQNRDIAAQVYLQSMQNNLELTMQTQDFTQQEKMTYLTYQLNDAMANNDLERQTQLIQYTTGLDLAKMREQYGYEAAMNEAQFQYNMALQTDNNVAAAAIQQMTLQFQAEENEKNRTLQQFELQLQQSGINMAQKEQEWNMIKDSVGAYAADTSSMVDYLNATLSETGITVKAPDPIDIYKQSLKELDGLKYEYMITHPQQVENGELTQEGLNGFNTFYNEAIWGETSASPTSAPVFQIYRGNEGGILTGTSLTGAKSVYVTPDMEDKLNNAIGKTQSFIDSTNGTTQTGRLVSWETTPRTLQVNIVDNYGNHKTIPIFWNDPGSYT